MSDRTSNGRLFERYHGVRYEIGIAGDRSGRFDADAVVDDYGARIFGAQAVSYDLALADIRNRVQVRIGLMLAGSVRAIQPL